MDNIKIFSELHKANEIKLKRERIKRLIDLIHDNNIINSSDYADILLKVLSKGVNSKLGDLISKKLRNNGEASFDFYIDNFFDLLKEMPHVIIPKIASQIVIMGDEFGKVILSKKGIAFSMKLNRIINSDEFRSNLDAVWLQYIDKYFSSNYYNKY